MRPRAVVEATITTSDNAAANPIPPPWRPGKAYRLRARAWRRCHPLRPHRTCAEPAGDDDALDTTHHAPWSAPCRRFSSATRSRSAPRLQLQRWLLGSTTGANRLKAGLPSDWKIGDKTGTNQRDANDIAYRLAARPAALLVAAYLAGSAADGAQKDRTLAAVGALVRDVFG